MKTFRPGDRVLYGNRRRLATVIDQPPVEERVGLAPVDIGSTWVRFDADETQIPVPTDALTAESHAK